MNKRFISLARALCAVLLIPAGALAAPGAHGPNGEHLDGPTQHGSGTAAPKVEAKSELFELVGTLSGGELSILVDRYDTNEPVLNAKVEVEAGPHKAAAKFHGDMGDYAVDDPAFLQALGKTGEHALVFTVAAGEQTDLLDGTLRVGAQATHDDHAHDHVLTRRNALAAGVVLLAAAGGVFLMRRRRSQRGGL